MPIIDKVIKKLKQSHQKSQKDTKAEEGNKSKVSGRLKLNAAIVVRLAYYQPPMIRGVIFGQFDGEPVPLKQTVQCPVCSEHFPQSSIEHHVNSCIEGNKNVGGIIDKDKASRNKQTQGKQRSVHIRPLHAHLLYSITF